MKSYSSQSKAKAHSIKKKTLLKKLKTKSSHDLAYYHGGGYSTHSIQIMNDIIYNEKSHIVAVFKDYLILDDVSEFLKRFYMMDESTGRIPKVCEFYESYSKIFPNYTNIPEAKYMYKNIKRKQKVIDNNQEQDADSNKIEEEFKVLNTEAVDSIMNQTNTKNEDSRLKFDESAMSLEGIIDHIGKAENIANSTISVKRNINKIESKNHGNQKNPYGFHLNLNNIQNKLGENVEKSHSKDKKNSDKNLYNHFSSGIANSSRNKSETKIIEDEQRGSLKIDSFKNQSPLLSDKFKIKENNESYKKVQTARDRRSSDLYDDKKNLKKSVNSQKNFIIYEEKEAIRKNLGKENAKTPDKHKMSHKSTISIPKFSTNIYNHFNIINNYQNIVFNQIQNNKKVNNNNRYSNKNNQSQKPSNGISNGKSSMKDLMVNHKQQVKKILVEQGSYQKSISKENFSQIISINPKSYVHTRTISHNDIQSKYYDHGQTKKLSTVNSNCMIKVLEDEINYDREPETDRLKSVNKIFSEILKTDANHKNTLVTQEDNNEQRRKKNLQTGSSLNFDKVSPNLSNFVKKVNNEYKQVLNAHENIKNKILNQRNPSSNLISKNYKDKNHNNSTSNKIRESSNVEIINNSQRQTQNKSNNKGYSNMLSNENVKDKFLNNNFIASNKQNEESQSILKIRNFLEINKISQKDNQAKTERLMKDYSNKNFKNKK